MARYVHQVEGECADLVLLEEMLLPRKKVVVGQQEQQKVVVQRKQTEVVVHGLGRLPQSLKSLRQLGVHPHGIGAHGAGVEVGWRRRRRRREVEEEVGVLQLERIHRQHAFAHQHLHELPPQAQSRPIVSSAHGLERHPVGGHSCSF